MKTKPNQFFSDIKPVRRQLEGWRRTRKHKDRIPESLWNAITQLAWNHGVSRVAKALRVNYYALKDRTEALPTPKPPSTLSPFVELPMAVSHPPPACVLEVEDRSGSKMTLRLASASGADAAALVEAFWRRPL